MSNHKKLPLTIKEVRNAIDERVSVVDKEFRAGLEFISKYPRSVSFFGSSKFDQKNEFCEQAYHLAKRVSSELGYAVVSGGGLGIMEAANRGAMDAGGVSLGLLIDLPEKQSTNKYLTDYLEFRFFFNRKVALSFSAEAYIFFPGGFGTMDEFFEIVTLVQTGKIPRVPIICVGKKYWGQMETFIKDLMIKQNKAIDEEDLNIIKITDDSSEVIEIIRNAPLRRE